MERTTMRYHTYQAPADGHNQRDEDIVVAENRGAEQGTKGRWIDPEGVHEVLGPGQTLLEGFDAVFGDVIDEYNSRQTRADRKMTVSGYLKSVADSRRGRPVKAIKRANERAIAQGREQDVRKDAGQRTHYEVVVSLGNVKPLRDGAGKVVVDEQTGLRKRPNYVAADVTKRILDDYIAGWAARNTHLYLFRGDYHADEWYKVTSGGVSKPGLPGQWLPGEAHGHFSFIPWAEGYQRGPKRQASITKALAAMGYVDYQDATGRTVTAWEQWQAVERDELRRIARQYGYEIVPADDSREALAADEYAELADLKGAVLDARATLADTEARTSDLVDREAAVSAREAELDAREAAIAPRERALEAQRERLSQAVDDFASRAREARDLDERLPRLRQQVKDEEDKVDKARQTAEDALKDAEDLCNDIEALKRQEAALKAHIEALQRQEDDAYTTAKEQGYRDGYTAGARDGAQSAMRQLNKQRDKTDAADAEQRRRAAERDGVGRR